MINFEKIQSGSYQARYGVFRFHIQRQNNKKWAMEILKICDPPNPIFDYDDEYDPFYVSKDEPDHEFHDGLWYIPIEFICNIKSVRFAEKTAINYWLMNSKDYEKTS